MRLKRYIFLSIIFCALIAPITHGNEEASNSTFEKVKPIKIGILHSLTGTMSISERSLVDAAQLAIAEINDAGGILGRPIEAIVEDGASDWPTFAEKAEKLINQDQVVSIFGCWTSSSRLHVIPIIEKYDHLLWYPLQYEGGESSANVIYTGAIPNQQIIPALDWTMENLGHKVFLVGSDYIFPRKTNSIIKDYLDRKNGIVVGEEYFSLGDKNFTQVVQQILAVKPDVILNTLNGDSNLGLFWELEAASSNTKKIPVLSFSIAEDELRSIGTNLTAGSFAAWTYFQSLDGDRNKKFVNKFKQEFGSDRVTDDPIEAAYYQIHLFAKAVARAGSADPAAVRRAVKGLTFNAPGGIIRVDPDTNHTWKTAHIGRINDNGQFEVVWSSAGPIRPRPHMESIDLLPNVDLSSKTTPQLVEFLYKGTVIQKRAAAQEIGLHSNKISASVFGPLRRALEDNDWLVRHYASDALVQLGEDSLPYLIDALKTDNDEIRLLAARALSRFGEKAAPAVSSLSNVLSSNDFEVRQEAINALFKIGSASQPAVDLLADLLNDPHIPNRVLTILALERIGYTSQQTLPLLSTSLSSESLPVRKAAATAIISLAIEIEDEGEIERIPILSKALKDMLETGADQEQVRILERSLAHLEDINKANWIKRFSTPIFGNFWFLVISAIVCSIIFIWLVGLRLFPLTILKANTVLEEIARFPIGDTVFTIPAKYVLLIGFFHYHPLILNAWVERHLPATRRNFRQLRTVVDRDIYVPAQVEIEGNEPELVTPSTFREICNSERWCISIRGEGGCGKTSLASQLGLWAMAEKESDRLTSGNCIIPVLIEPGVKSESLDNAIAFHDLVSARLQSITEATDKPTKRFVDQLLHQRKVMVILDDLSELATMPWTVPDETSFGVHALIITARFKDRLIASREFVVEPQRISVSEILPFISDYLKQSGVIEKFTDDDIYNSATRIKSIVGKRDITPLFVRLYLDQMIGFKREDTVADPPRDVPSLVLGYLNELNRNRKKDKDPDDHTVQTEAKALAWACTSEHLRPTRIPINKALEVLKPETALQMLQYLENNLRIIQTIGVEKDSIAFTLDPLAEQLAALELVSELEEQGEEGWTSWLAMIKKNGTLKSGTDFIRAIYSCSYVRPYMDQIPMGIPLRLAKLVDERTEDATIRIGILFSLSGTMAISARSLAEASRLAVDEINEEGGILGLKLEAFIEDGGSNEEQFKAKAKELIQKERVVAIFGCWTSASRKAVLNVIEAHNNLLWYPLQYEGEEMSPNVIYTGAVPNQQILPALKWAMDEMGSNVFLIGSDYIFPRTANRIIKKYVEENGGQICGEEYVQLGSKDFNKIVEKIKKKPHTNVIINTVNGDSNIGLFYALSEANITAETIPVLSFSIAEDELRSIGTNLTAGHYAAWMYFQSLDTPENRHFVEAYKRAFGMDRVTDDPIEAAYSQIHLFARAVKHAKSTAAMEVKKAAQGMEMTTPSGLIKIDEQNQHVWKTPRIGRIGIDGQFEIVWDAGELVRPDPYLTGTGLPPSDV